MLISNHHGLLSTDKRFQQVGTKPLNFKYLKTSYLCSPLTTALSKMSPVDTARFAFCFNSLDVLTPPAPCLLLGIYSYTFDYNRRVEIVAGPPIVPLNQSTFLLFGQGALRYPPYHETGVHSNKVRSGGGTPRRCANNAEGLSKNSQAGILPAQGRGQLARLPTIIANRS